MTLNEFQILTGIFSIVVVVIYSLVGLKIALRYIEKRQRDFLLVGITWFGLASPWWPSSISFILAMATGGNGLQDNPEIYFILGNILIPVFLITWIIAFTDLLYKEQQKIIIWLFIIYGVAFEVVFFALLFSDPASIGELSGPVDVEYLSFVSIFLLSILVILFITGYLFGRESMRSDNPEIKLKGKLIIISITLFDIGAAMDAALELTLPILIVARIILILSALGFYGGFLLPNWIKKLFLKT
ncbi:MAG: hypothetical protein ACP6IY_16550 [Promethearchaeia archaeon]